jgi:hypothetical protein
MCGGLGNKRQIEGKFGVEDLTLNPAWIRNVSISF